MTDKECFEKYGVATEDELIGGLVGGACFFGMLIIVIIGLVGHAMSVIANS